jgi:hypothetical protein
MKWRMANVVMADALYLVLLIESKVQFYRHVRTNEFAIRHLLIRHSSIRHCSPHHSSLLFFFFTLHCLHSLLI